MSRQDSKQIENVKVMLLKGENGSNIEKIEKTGTSGLVDTYTVTLSDGSKTTFTVTNGKAITSVAKTGTQGLTDTYTITFNDGSTETFSVSNGNGITGVAKTGTSGLVDTYTITFDDGTTETFDVTNGLDGEDGNGITSVVKTGTSGLVDTYTITFDDGTTETFDVTNGANGQDVSQSNLAPVETGNTASQSYAIGKHLIWNGAYYKVIQAIAVGDSFNVGVNLQIDTVASDIEALEEGVIYSTEETIIGKWSDGKTLYRQTFLKDSLSVPYHGNTDWRTSVRRGTTAEMEKISVKRCYGSVRSPNNGELFLPYATISDFTVKTQMTNSYSANDTSRDININIASSGNSALFTKLNVTIEYTID